MRYLKSTLIAFVVLVCATSCEKVTGDGPVVTESRTSIGFTEVKFELDGKVIIEKGADYSMEISAQRNILDEIVSDRNGDELKLKFKSGVRIRNHEPVTVRITMPKLQALTLGGSGDIETSGGFSGNQLKLTVNGSGNIEMDLAEYSLFQAWLNGSGDIRVAEGSANTSELTIAGSGSVQLENLAAKSVKATTNGSGTMRVWATEELRATINGSGSIFYKGEPSVLDTHVSGSGRITKL